MCEIDYKTAYENVIIANRSLEKELKQLKKQKDDVVEYAKKLKLLDYETGIDLLRMLGEIDEIR